MASTIQVRVEDELKIQSDKLFKSLGTDTTTAIRIFLTQAIANNGFPFEIKKTNGYSFPVMSEKEILYKLEKARNNSNNKEYQDADLVAEDIRARYGV